MSTQTNRYLHVRSGRPYRFDGQWGYHALVTPDGAVWVYNRLMDCYDTCHSLTAGQMAYVRARATADGPAVRCAGE